MAVVISGQRTADSADRKRPRSLRARSSRVLYSSHCSSSLLTYRPPSAVRRSLNIALANVDDGLRDRVRRRDHLRIRLEVALRGDHVDELLRDIHVRGFERARLNQSEARITGLAAHGLTRRERLRPHRVSKLLQPLWVREVRDRHLAERLRATVREARLNDAGRIDVDADQASGRIAVLRHGADVERVAVLTRAREVERDAHVLRARIGRMRSE